MTSKPKRVERHLTVASSKSKQRAATPPPKAIKQRITNPQFKGMTTPCYRPISYVKSDDSTYVPGSSGWERSLLESIWTSNAETAYQGLDTESHLKRLRALRLKMIDYLSESDVLRSFPNMELALTALNNCSSKAPCNLRFCPYCHFGFVMKNIHLLYPVLGGGEDCLTFTWIVDDVPFDQFQRQVYEKHTGGINSPSLFGRECNSKARKCDPREDLPVTVSPYIDLASKDWHRKTKDILKAMLSGFEKEYDCSALLLMFPDVKWKADEQKFSVHYHGIIRCTEHVNSACDSKQISQTHKGHSNASIKLARKLLLKLRQKRVNPWRIDYSSPVVDLPRYLSYQQKIPFVQWKDFRSLDPEQQQDVGSAEKLMVLWSLQDQLACLSYGLGPSVSKQLLSTVDYSLEFSWQRMRGPKSKDAISLDL